MSDKKTFLGMPGYGRQSAKAGRALWRARRDMSNVAVEYQAGSLLACNFNKLWCTALNMVHRGERVDYFAMLHDDVGAQDFWLDTLIEEMEAKNLDVLGVVVPIKDLRGMTSIAVHTPGDNWNPECRLTMHDVFELPETFTSEDLGGQKLLLNTGCWVARWNQEWCRQVRFTINDRIVFDKPQNAYRPEVESEDWYFSRLLNDMGLKIGATRKVTVRHEGDVEFTNELPWGTDSFDHESTFRERRVSPVPGAFPYDIAGWLLKPEGKALAEIAAGKRVLEIGSYCGLSTVCMARTATHVTAVDYFDGRGTPNPGDTLERFKSNLERHGLREKVTIQYPDWLERGELPRPEFDLVFIDGEHTREAVFADVVKACNLLAPGGLIAFHDYKAPCHQGVEEAVDALILDGGELISVTETLAVVRPPAAIPLEV